MNTNIRAGMRVLYKQGNNNWMTGEIVVGSAEVNRTGLYIPIKSQENENGIYFAELNQIFWDAFPLEDYIKDYHDYFMTKEDYIKFIESDEFDKRLENAYVSDGEFGYYPVSKYSRQWLEKQPFDYIVRYDR